MKRPAPLVHLLADGTTSIIPVYGWEDGWWIGRVTAIADRSMKATRAGVTPKNSAWFALVSPDNWPRTPEAPGASGGELGGELIAYESPLTPGHRLWFTSTLLSRGPLAKLPQPQLTAAKRWWPFARDLLFLDGAGISPLPFPGFMDDRIFESIDEQYILDIHSALDPETDTLEDVTIAAVLLLESVFGETTLEEDGSISIPFSRGRLNFWWHWGRPHLPWRMNRVSRNGVGGGVLRAETLGKLIWQMKSIGTVAGSPPYDVPIILPKSEEHTWAPPGRPFFPLDLSPWKLLGVHSPYLELDPAVFSEWLEAVSSKP